MRDFADWLARRPAGPKPRRPLPRVSPKRRKESAEYRRIVAEKLSEDPRCQIGPVLKAAGIDVQCLGVGTHPHHTKGRGKHLCDKSSLLTSCSGGCHPGWVHAHPAKARKLGLLV